MALRMNKIMLGVPPIQLKNWDMPFMMDDVTVAVVSVMSTTSSEKISKRFSPVSTIVDASLDKD